MLKKYFVKMFGSEKSYLFVKMQLAIVLSIVFSVLYAFFKDYLYLQLIPAMLLFLCFMELRKNYRKDFWLYSIIFSILFAVIVFTPLLFHKISLSSNPLESLKYLVYVAFALLVLLIFSRTISAKKITEGRVLLADKKMAVVEVDFDLLGGVRAGKYVVENNGAKKGDSVKVLIKRGFFRGPYLYRIVGRRV